MDTQEILSWAKARWPGVSERTKIIVTERRAVILPVLAEHPRWIQTAVTRTGRLWSALRWVARRLRWTWLLDKTMQPLEYLSRFEQERIDLEKWVTSWGDTFYIGYSPKVDILAIRYTTRAPFERPLTAEVTNGRSGSVESPHTK